MIKIRYLIALFFALVFSGSFNLFGQSSITVSGTIKDQRDKSVLPYVNVIVKTERDSTFVTGTVTNDEGFFKITSLQSGNYLLEISFIGYKTRRQPLFIGKLSNFLDMSVIELEQSTTTLNEVVVTGKQDEVSQNMDKKTFNMSENTSQSGGSVLQAMRNLSSITVDQDGKISLRGSDKVTVLIDGKQTALTGFGNQSGLDNIPASAIEKIEIINNPSAKYDANGNAGIINIVFKKNKETGLNGKTGLIFGVGELGQKRANYPTIRNQYQYNPKLNPSLSLNYKTQKLNVFIQGDLLTQKSLNKNEYFDRLYADSTIREQFMENRTQTIYTIKGGIDLYLNDNNTLTVSGLFSRENHIDRGDVPYFNNDFSERLRLWQYYEHEINTSATASASYQHKFMQPGHLLNVNLNYTFHREDEKFFFNNQLLNQSGNDTTLLIADENVTDFTVDYIKPLKHGRFETGTKLRWRYIPTNMVFRPGNNSILDPGAQGWANYNESVSAVYGTYVYESKRTELEAGVRLEYVNVDYKVDPNNDTYKSNGYNYFQPFPNFRFSYLFNDQSKLTLFYNRRVDRPDEQDLRVFPKYDDPEILKTGNPALHPQFTQSMELGYRTNWNNGYLYSAFYYRASTNLLTRILTTPPNSTNINSIAQNAGNGYNYGVELVFSQNVAKLYTINMNGNIYKSIISAFTIQNVYPLNVPYTSSQQETYSGNVKLNNIFHLPSKIDVQLTGIYLAPDLIPQGKIDSRYSVDLGAKKSIQSGKGELFVNATDIFNTMRIKKDIISDGVRVKSIDLYETQAIRVGYNYKF